jgi:hypothetical protein
VQQEQICYIKILNCYKCKIYEERTYKGSKDKDYVKNKSLCGVVEEISNGTRENNNGNNNNVEKKLKGENRVNFSNEEPSKLRVLIHHRAKTPFFTLHIYFCRHSYYALQQDYIEKLSIYYLRPIL